VTKKVETWKWRNRIGLISVLDKRNTKTKRGGREGEREKGERGRGVKIKERQKEQRERGRKRESVRRRWLKREKEK
jgi:hypothetical protein